MAEENLWKEYIEERVKQILEEMDSVKRGRSGRLQEDILNGMPCLLYTSPSPRD